MDDVVGADAVCSVGGGDPGADGAGGGGNSGNPNPENRVGVGGRVMKGMQAGHRIARPNNGGSPSIASLNAPSSSPPVGSW